MTNFGWWQALAMEYGRIFCSICFESLPVEEAYMDDQGQRWDMCKECGEREVRDRG